MPDATVHEDDTAGFRFEGDEQFIRVRRDIVAGGVSVALGDVERSSIIFVNVSQTPDYIDGPGRCPGRWNDDGLVGVERH